MIHQQPSARAQPSYSFRSCSQLVLLMCRTVICRTAETASVVVGAQDHHLEAHDARSIVSTLSSDARPAPCAQVVGGEDKYRAVCRGCYNKALAEMAKQRRRQSIGVVRCSALSWGHPFFCASTSNLWGSDWAVGAVSRVRPVIVSLQRLLRHTSMCPGSGK